MEGADQRRPAPGEPFAAQTGDGLGGGKESLRGAGAQSTNRPGRESLELTKEEWGAGLDLNRKRRPVVGRTALYHVSDVDLFSPETERLDHVIEEFARSANKGSPLPVLIKTRTFPHEDQSGSRRALAKDNLRAAGMQAATGALAEMLPDVEQKLLRVALFGGGFTLKAVDGSSASDVFMGQSLIPIRCRPVRCHFRHFKMAANSAPALCSDSIRAPHR